MGVTIWHDCVRVHGNITLSLVWVHGTVIHHSWSVLVEFVFRTTSNEDSYFNSGNVRGLKCKPKSYVNRDENTRSGYHVDLEMSDRSRE